MTEGTISFYFLVRGAPSKNNDSFLENQSKPSCLDGYPSTTNGLFNGMHDARSVPIRIHEREVPDWTLSRFYDLAP